MGDTKQNSTNLIAFFFLAVLAAPLPGILFGPLSIKIIDLAVLVTSFSLLCIFIYREYRSSLQDWVVLLIKDKTILFILLASLSVLISTVYGSIAFSKVTSLTNAYELYRYAFYFVFYLLAAYFLTDLQRFFKITMVSFFVIEVFGVLQFFNAFNINYHLGLFYTKSEELHMMIQDQNRITSTFGNPNVYGSFLIIVLSFTLSIIYMYRKKTSLFNWLLLSLTVLTLFSIYLTTSRTTVITAFGLLVYMGLFQAIVQRKFLKEVIIKTLVSLLFFVGIGFALVPQIPYLNSAAQNITETLKTFDEEKESQTNGSKKDSATTDSENQSHNTDSNSSSGNTNDASKVKKSLESVSSFKSRYYYWGINFGKFKQSPVVGAGPMKQGLSFADNSYLYILARYGLLGMLIYLVFLIYVFFKSFAVSMNQNINKKKRIIASTINFIIVAYAVMGIVSEAWFNIESMVAFFLLLGLLKNKHLDLDDM